MTINSILVPFLDEPSARPAFETAALLAEERNAHISCLHVRQRPAPSTTVIYPLGGVFTEFTEEFQETENKLASDLKQLFDALCAEARIGVGPLREHSDDKGVTASWRDREGDLLWMTAQRAMTCDVSLLAALGGDASPLAQYVTEELLFQSGRPVLLRPTAGPAVAPKKIVVAWNGRAEAARAVAGGLDLLREAEAVKVLTVRKAEAPPVSTDDMTAYLRLHGVKAAETEIELAEDENETETLDEEIGEFGADLLIMGAYSHSRWREAVLGGFTRHIMKHSTIPVLMAQ